MKTSIARISHKLSKSFMYTPPRTYMHNIRKPSEGFKYRLITCVTSVIFLLLSHFGFTQSTGLKAWIEKRSAKKEASIAAGKPFLSPLVGPGYTPETGLLIAGGFLYTFKTNSEDSLIQRSSLPITAFISTKGNVGFSAKLASFWWQDRIRFNLVAKYSDADDDYFGATGKHN